MLGRHGVTNRPLACHPAQANALRKSAQPCTVWAKARHVLTCVFVHTCTGRVLPICTLQLDGANGPVFGWTSHIHILTKMEPKSIKSWFKNYQIFNDF